MRRIAQLLLLLAFALTRAAAAQCPMAAPAAGAAEHAMHPAMHHHAHRPAPGHPDAPQHRADCGVVMPCGLAAISSAATVDVRLPADSRAAPAWAPGLYASPVIPILSPPPRVALPA